MVFVYSLSAGVFAQPVQKTSEQEAAPAAVCNLPKDAPAVTAGSAVQTQPTLTPAEQKKAFKARRKQIKKLVKAYRKASAEEKPAIKAQLEKLVSDSVDAGMVYVKNRIAAERANLDNWEAKVNADQANLQQVKAQRVEDLLSGEAERKHKAAKKAWKKQLKAAKKKMK